jgi:2-hydroxymuconate-semialdehyde hydrolase
VGAKQVKAQKKQSWASRFITVDGLQFHYLEAGPSDAEPVVLLHSGEYGAAAEFSWEYSIDALAETFHVIAPDFIGYGHSSKVFDFADPLGFRIRTIRRFCEAMNITEAQFMGNSMGGTLMCYVATQEKVSWPMRTMVLVSGGGNPLDNEYRRIVQDFDGTFQKMDSMTVLTFTRRWYDDEYIERRVEMSKVVGAWECTAAPRFRAPFRESRSEFSAFWQMRYENIKIPTILFAAGNDKFREPGFEKELIKRIAGLECHVFPDAGHMLHIEFPERFNKLCLDFLTRHRVPDTSRGKD